MEGDVTAVDREEEVEEEYMIVHKKGIQCSSCCPGVGGGGGGRELSTPTVRIIIIVVLSLIMLSLVVCSLIVTMATGVPRDVTSSRDPGGGGEIDWEELKRLGIKTEDILEHLRHLSEGKYGCGTSNADYTTEMQRYFLSNNSVTCNDGSNAGYYLRRSTEGSTRWLVFLEGGWYCFDHNSCQGRWLNNPNLMSSTRWAHTRRGSGILSWNPDNNPYAYNANLVYVPYCSSDSWSGTHKGGNGEFSFMGALIVEEVMNDLIRKQGMHKGTKLLLAGSSAGGVGVLVNLDRVAAQMAQLLPSMDVRGIADSGWFLDNEQYEPVPCADSHSCAPTEGIQRGLKLWRGQVPDACKQSYTEDQHWRCFFGYRLYKTLKTPVFVVQNLFDEAQIMVDNVGTPVKTKQWQYIHNMGQDMKRTVMNVSAIFAPACLSHIILTKNEWKHVSINSVTLPQALQCWEDGLHERNRYHTPGLTHSRRRSYTEAVERLITGTRRRENREKLLMDEAPNSHKYKGKRGRKKRKRDRERGGGKRQRERDRARKLRRRLARQQQQQENASSSSSSSTVPSSRPTPSPPPSSSSRLRRSILFDQHDLHHMEYHDNQCNHHRIDHCAWPQCNFSCPKIRNPFTGEELDFIDLLMQFGLDLSSIANALNMDLPTLQAMDHDVLLRLLIQQGR